MATAEGRKTPALQPPVLIDSLDTRTPPAGCRTGRLTMALMTHIPLE